MGSIRQLPTYCICTCRVRVGARVGFAWNVTHQNAQRDKVMVFAAALNPSAPPKATLDVAVQSASLPLTGSYSLGIGRYCDTVQVDVGDSADVIEAKINQLPGVDGECCSVTQSCSWFGIQGLGCYVCQSG